MRNKLATIFIPALCLLVVWTIISCRKEKKATGTDKELYDMAKTTDGFVWFKNSGSLLNKSAGSGQRQRQGGAYSEQFQLPQHVNPPK